MNEKTLPPEMYRLPSNLMPLDATELSDQQNLNLMINIWIFYYFIYLNIIIWIFFFFRNNYLLNRVRIFTSGITFTLKLVISFSDSVISFFLYSSTSLDLFFFSSFFYSYSSKYFKCLSINASYSTDFNFFWYSLFIF